MASWAVDSPVGGECRLTDMPSSFAIGDFSRATHLTVKTLRHYHETGLLEPAHIDPQTGYRRYTTDQIPVAQIIRRFRDLDMPLHELRARSRHSGICSSTRRGRPRSVVARRIKCPRRRSATSSMSRTYCPGTWA